MANPSLTKVIGCCRCEWVSYGVNPAMVMPMTPKLNHLEAEVAGLLVGKSCPLSFAHVRAFMMGSIASPSEQISPQLVLQTAWRGKIPEFKSLDDVNAFYDLLINRFWNSLVQHQERKNPFRLLPASCKPTLGQMGALATLRLEEVSGFFDGLCGPDDELVLPRRANQALEALNGMTPLLAGLAKLSLDKSQKARPEEIQMTIRQIDELTEIAEKEINAAILACHRDRTNQLTRSSTGKNRIH